MNDPEYMSCGSYPECTLSRSGVLPFAPATSHPESPQAEQREPTDGIQQKCKRDPDHQAARQHRMGGCLIGQVADHGEDSEVENLGYPQACHATPSPGRYHH